MSNLNLLDDDLLYLAWAGISSTREEFNHLITRDGITAFIFVRVQFMVNSLIQTLTIHPEIAKWEEKNIYMNNFFLDFNWLSNENIIEGWKLLSDENSKPDTVIITCGKAQQRQYKIDSLFDNSKNLYKKIYKLAIDDISINQFIN